MSLYNTEIKGCQNQYRGGLGLTIRDQYRQSTNKWTVPNWIFVSVYLSPTTDMAAASVSHVQEQPKNMANKLTLKHCFQLNERHNWFRRRSDGPWRGWSPRWAYPRQMAKAGQGLCLAVCTFRVLSFIVHSGPWRKHSSPSRLRRLGRFASSPMNRSTASWLVHSGMTGHRRRLRCPGSETAWTRTLNRHRWTDHDHGSGYRLHQTTTTPTAASTQGARRFAPLNFSQVTAIQIHAPPVHFPGISYAKQ